MSDVLLDRDDHELRDTHLEERELRARLAKTWGTASGIIGRLSSVDHKVIGRRYIVTAFIFLFLAGIAADGGLRGLSRAAHGGHAQHRIPAPQRL
jgi:cytochrome c oxidase subunit 1